MTIRTRNAITSKRRMVSKVDVRLVSRGWDALIEKLGYADATRFVMQLDRGSGDSVKYFRDLWKDTSAEEIYRKMKARRRHIVE